MNAYEYGLKYFNVKYQPESNCVVFNDKFTIKGEKESDNQSSYVSSPITYEQVSKIGEKKFKYLANPKRFNATIANDYLLPNGYLIKTEGNTIEEEPNGMYEVYEYNKEYYVQKKSPYLQLLDEVVIERDKLKKKIVSPKFFALAGKKLREILGAKDVSLVFFFTEEGAVLEDAYAKIKDVAANEILFFLEKESDFNPVSVIKVKTGAGISERTKMPYTAISELANFFGVSASSEKIEEAFATYFSAVKDEDLNGVSMVLYEIGDFLLQVTSEALKGLLGDPLVIIGEWLPTVLKCEPNRWQYYDKEGKVNKKFAPFIPGFKDFLDGDAKEQQVKETNQIDANVSLLRAKLNEAVKKVPNADFRKFLFQKLSFAYDLLDAFEELYESVKKLFTSKNLFIFFNALLIGLWNSIVEAVSGILVLVGQIINIPAYLLKEDRMSFSQSIAIGRELLESGIEAFLDLLTIKNIQALFNGVLELSTSLLKVLSDPQSLVSKLSDGVNYVSTKVDRIGYGVGYVVGFIVEEVLTAIATGGAKTVAEAFRLTMKSFTEALDAIRNVPKLVAKKAASMTHTLVALFKKLRSLDIPKLIEEFVSWVQKIIKTSKQLAEEAFESFFGNSKGGRLDKQYLRKRKYKPTAIHNNIMTLCPIS